MMTNEHDSFFVSESLKDILDEQAILESNFEINASEHQEVELLGTFVYMSLEKSQMKIEVTSKVAKVLLDNPDTTFLFDFMERKWRLFSDQLELSMEEGKMYATLRFV